MKFKISSKDLLNAIVISFLFSSSLLIIYIFLNITITELITKKHKVFWKKTSAIITSIDLVDEKDMSLDEDIREVFLNKKCKISYLYSFNYKNYEGNTIGELSKKIDIIEFNTALFNKLQNKKTCYVWVNSLNPEESQLLLNRFYIIALLIYKGFLLFSIILAFYFVLFNKNKFQ